MSQQRPWRYRHARRIAIGIASVAAPLPLAILFLVIGLFSSLAWVYASIAMSVASIPCLAIGAFLLVRSSPPPSAQFDAPPGWPPPPEGWRPPSDWTPDPQWPAAPEGWQWWVSSR